MKKETALSILEGLKNGSIDFEDYALRKLEIIQKKDNVINAYISLDSEDFIREKIMEIKEKLASGKNMKIPGLIVSVKDNISTNFLPTTAASKILENYVPPYNATVVEKILEEGGIIIGKTNLDEFAMGSTTEFSAYGVTKNPWDITRVPGGSSGGSAASLSYGSADLSLGSDTGGSVRLPASYTATVGLKPTYGTISRYGLIPYANSLEQISPMARSVKDVSLILDVIKGYDPRDATSLNFEYREFNEKKFKICVPDEFIEGSENPIKSAIYNLLEKIEGEGIVIEYGRKFDKLNYALSTYYTIAFAEAASNLSRYDGKLYPNYYEGRSYREMSENTRKNYFGFEVKKRILMGIFALSEGFINDYYIAATKGRRIIRDEILKMTNDCIIAGSVSPILPPKIGERINDPLKLYAMDIYTVVANLAGVPALAMPAGFYNGLPIGIQFMAGPYEERKLLELGSFIEDKTGLYGIIAGD
ncbi:glutamyl-tRNA(Gln) and/or aspartyl-tRNA(Asn) amidotransferase, A subunit [Caldisphaera lagunensis DSM 15908]|uniref:Glutamyl-tRNA(Gln) amidotransferase subunit A n=1 Tax=Caldisphaera lagunensis (strain DSM 15908 / JCM 11604 / ANMR 0165 / IC-154) TaxID=1056495 RepID=L0ADX6_CALLD|nr:Asp-tRNA(Asn)/Glu-tRNA(Gln) amidotransferase subunit GatA [Caldisphaera lagunensis]AFZ71255.1 glutamyl-tRNA(Gln) and/or aspartyl-tRNA(Asn) amidotransferase, A subunit [Caldisphaera lagunensis DSM 15908]